MTRISHHDTRRRLIVGLSETRAFLCKINNKLFDTLKKKKKKRGENIVVSKQLLSTPACVLEWQVISTAPQKNVLCHNLPWFRLPFVGSFVLTPVLQLLILKWHDRIPQIQTEHCFLQKSQACLSIVFTSGVNPSCRSDEKRISLWKPVKRRLRVKYTKAIRDAVDVALIQRKKP